MLLTMTAGTTALNQLHTKLKFQRNAIISKGGNI